MFPAKPHNTRTSPKSFSAESLLVRAVSSNVARTHARLTAMNNAGREPVEAEGCRGDAWPRRLPWRACSWRQHG